MIDHIEKMDEMKLGEEVDFTVECNLIVQKVHLQCIKLLFKTTKINTTY